MSQCRLKEQLLLFIGRLVLQGRDEHGVVKTELYDAIPKYQLHVSRTIIYAEDLQESIDRTKSWQSECQSRPSCVH